MKRLLTICAVAAIVLTVSGTAKAVILDVGPGQTYATITAAVGAANTAGGDTIIVHEGTYNERVYIQGFNGLTVKAADGDTVTVEGEAGKIGSIVVSTSSFVTIEGLGVTGRQKGIWLWNSHDSKILNNVITDSTLEGIFIGGESSRNEVAQNEISKAQYGIVLNGADDNNVVKNKITDSTTGILFHDSHDNEVTRNDIAGLTHEGIFLLAGSSGNTVAHNEISQIWWGIKLVEAGDNDIIKNNISDSLTGILFDNSHDNKVMHNEIADVPFEGIFLLGGSSGNKVAQNEISQVEWGIVLNGADENDVRQNEISPLWRGIVLISANDNDVQKNEVADSGDAGIFAWLSSGNLFKKNEVSDSGWIDLYDSSAPTLDNTWENNKYETKNW